MSGPAWMPFYVGDYLKDTAHLSTFEHGAYLLLIMHYWQHGGLPNDDRQLAAIVRVRTEKWHQLKTRLEPFFMQGWTHNRIEKELAKAQETILKRRMAGLASAVVRRKKWPTHVRTHVEHVHVQSPSTSSFTVVDTAARAEKEAPEEKPKPPALEVTPQLLKSRLARKNYDR